MDQLKKIKLSYLLTFSIFISLNVNPNFLMGDYNLIYAISFIRFFLPIAIVIIVLSISFNEIANKNFLKIKNLEINILFLILFLILISSIFNQAFDLDNLYFLNYFVIFILYLNLNTKNNEKEILGNITLFLLCNFITYSLLIIYQLYLEPLSILELYKSYVFQFDTRFLGQSMPRSTGAARVFFLFFLFVILLLNFNKKYKYTLMFILSFFIFALFSRTTIIFFVVSLIFMHIFIKIYKEKIFVNLLTFLFVPFIFVYFLSFIAISNVKKQEIIINEKDDELIKEEFEKDKEEFEKDKNVLSNFLIIKSENNDLSDIENISTGRITLWKKVIKDLRFNLFGDGILSDKKIYNQSVSNGYIYSYISGGIITFILFIFFNLKVIFKIFKLYANNKNNLIFWLGATYISYFMFRIFFENGFILYIFDLYFIILTLLLINSKFIIKNISQK